MFTSGIDFIPPAIHAGGLRYHGASPLVSRLVHDGVIRAVAYHQNEVFEAALTFARTEGIIVAPEAAHAVKAAIDQALLCRKTGEEKVILFNNSGHGNFDFSAYEAYLAEARLRIPPGVDQRVSLQAAGEGDAGGLDCARRELTPIQDHGGRDRPAS